MKIALMGPNPSNFLYDIGVGLRRLGHEVVLFNDSWYISDQPIWHHREIELPSSHPLLSGFSGPKAVELMRQIERDLDWQNPGWVKRFYENFTSSGSISAKALSIIFSPSYGYIIFRRLLTNYSKSLLSHSYKSLIKMLTEIEQCDIAIVSGDFALYAYLIGKPYVMIPYGTEVFPEYALSRKDRIIQVQGARLILSSGALMLQFVKQLGLESKFRNYLLPLDLDLYRPMDKAEIGNVLSSFNPISLENKFTFLITSRSNFALKGTDKVIRAFKKLVKYNDKARLILIKWGSDTEKVEHLIESLNLQGFCILYPNMLSDPKLAKLYNSVDVVLDQFPTHLGDLGVIGDIGRKVLATGRPLITSFNSAANSLIYDELPPLIHAYTEDEIYRAMVELIENPSYANELGEKARNWSVRYHGPNAANKLVEILNKIR